MTAARHTVSADHWPYPRWVAHRGSGRLAPENTLAAFRNGAAHGYRMFECDVKLSADGLPFLLHDSTLERTSTGTGIAGEKTWSSLSQFDAGSWHSRRFAGEPIPTLDAITRYCLANGFDLNIEIKPTPGTARITGETVAGHASRLWASAARPPLLTSFEPEALAGARESAPGLPRGLLLDALTPDWLDVAGRLGCVAVVLDHALWNASTIAQAGAAGLRKLGYTVNDDRAAQRLVALGVDAIITDRVDLFPPSA